MSAALLSLASSSESSLLCGVPFWPVLKGRSSAPPLHACIPSPAAGDQGSADPPRLPPCIPKRPMGVNIRSAVMGNSIDLMSQQQRLTVSSDALADGTGNLEHDDSRILPGSRLPCPRVACSGQPRAGKENPASVCAGCRVPGRWGQIAGRAGSPAGPVAPRRRRARWLHVVSLEAIGPGLLIARRARSSRPARPSLRPRTPSVNPTLSPPFLVLRQTMGQ
jgi:hypothetical protein